MLTSQLAPRDTARRDAGSVRCDMSNSVPTVGLFTENCIIIAEGFLRADRVFEVVCLGFPHLESRIDFRCAPLLPPPSHSQEEPRMTRAVSLQKHYKIQLKHPLYQGYSRAVALALALCC